MSSPINMSSVARGLFVHDEDTGSSPLAPLGLHAVRLRMKPSRVIQTVSLFMPENPSFFLSYIRIGCKRTPYFFFVLKNFLAIIYVGVIRSFFIFPVC